MKKVGYLRTSDHVNSVVASPGFLRVITLCAVFVNLLAVALVLISIPGTHIGFWLIVCLALLILLAGQHEVIFGDQTALNGSMVVLVAAAGTLVGGGPIWIPVLCGLLGGLNWDHVRRLELRKIVVNGACTTLAAAIAAGLAEVAYPISNIEWFAVLASGTVAALTYWLVDNGLVAIVLNAVDGRPLMTHVNELTRSETLLVPFGLAGFVSGYYALHGLSAGAAALAVLGLLSAADLVVFGTPEIDVGLWPYMITVPLLRSMPARVALELMATGRRMSAEEAVKVGFINRLVPADELDSAVESFAGSLVAKSPLILRLGRRSFYRALSMHPDDALDYLQTMLTVTLSSEDTEEGLAAFGERRPPRWRGK